MSLVNKLDYEKLMQDCNEELEPFEGQLIVTGPVVCKTCAYYVGRWCAEWLSGHWVTQPYSRETDYFGTVQEAIDVQGRMFADELECKLSELGELLTG